MRIVFEFKANFKGRNYMKKVKIKPYLQVLLSFALVILIGSILLVLPISQKSNHFANYWDSLLLSTSAVCVTGLTPYANLSASLTIFGQIILLLLVQIGGLGFITIFTFFLTIFGAKFGAIDRFMLKEALSINRFSGILGFVKKIIRYTFIIEGIGILICSFIFIPEYGFAHGLWLSIFHAISSFNNAGFDLLGSTSLIKYANNIPLNIVTMLLIIVGGIGFPVIEEVLHNKPKKWSCYTKIVLVTTTFLIICGTLALWIAESSNNITFLEALFQSVSARTAGFASIDISLLTTPGEMILEILMFIGASPLSTGGGVKTTTFFVIVIAILSYIRGKQPIVFNRKISQESVTKAMSLIFVASGVLILGIFGVSIIENCCHTPYASKTGSIIFECFSAFGTAGYSQSLTPYLQNGSKVILCLLMYFGRVGPMTILNVFSKSFSENEHEHVRYIEENVVIG